MEIKLVMFDLDGVLVDACEWHRVALNEALQEVCDYQISIQDHYDTFNGIPTKVKLQKLTELGFVDLSQHEQIYELKQSKTIDVINKHAQVRSEKIDLLKFLKDSGITVACFTNSIRETTKLMLEKTGIINLFDAIITNQDVVEPKPSPEGYLKILNIFKVNPEHAIIVEDSPKGLQSANQTGCHVIEVAGPEEVGSSLFTEYVSG